MFPLLFVALLVGATFLLPPSPNTATPEELDSFYSGFGGAADRLLGQYLEHSELVILASHSQLSDPTVKAVLEFGSGEGAFAEELLEDYLSPSVSYRGLELSQNRVDDANARLEKYGDRATTRLNPTGVVFSGVKDESLDRVLSTFVVDLLSYEEIDGLLDEAERTLKPGGLVGIASLSVGSGPVSQTISSIWNALHTLSPILVGGCRPVDTAKLIEQHKGRWTLEFVHRNPWLPLESVVARKN